MRSGPDTHIHRRYRNNVMLTSPDSHNAVQRDGWRRIGVGNGLGGEAFWAVSVQKIK